MQPPDQPHEPHEPAPNELPALHDRRIVVTRAVPQAAPLIAAIRERGGEAIELPLLEIVEPVDDGAGLRAALAELVEQDWLVVLSPNGARRVLDQASAIGLAPDGCLLAVIAGGTAAVMEAAGWTVNLRPEVASSDGLLAAFEMVDFSGRVLVAQAENGRITLARGLVERGVAVSTAIAYRNVIPEIDPAAIDAARTAHTVLFASPSAVERYVAAVGVVPEQAVCIGGVTASTALAAGFEITIAAEPTLEAIVALLR